MGAGVVNGHTFGFVYNHLLGQIAAAKESSPRGMKTRELIGMTFHIENPRSRLVWAKGRRWSLPFALAEYLWIVAGRNDLEFLRPYNTKMRDFSDDGETLYGAYGRRAQVAYVDWEAKEPRLEHVSAFDGVIKKLKSDASSRQAVVPIFYGADLFAKSKDIPCTLSWQFLLRDDQLNMINTVRSNDVFWGTPYDVFVATMVQEVMALELGVDLGWYRHQAGSLHCYEKHYDRLESMRFEAVTMPRISCAEEAAQILVAENEARGRQLYYNRVDPRTFMDWEVVNGAGIVFYKVHAGARPAGFYVPEWVERFV